MWRERTCGLSQPASPAARRAALSLLNLYRSSLSPPPSPLELSLLLLDISTHGSQAEETRLVLGGHRNPRRPSVAPRRVQAPGPRPSPVRPPSSLPILLAAFLLRSTCCLCWMSDSLVGLARSSECGSRTAQACLSTTSRPTSPTRRCWRSTLGVRSLH